MSSPTAEQQKAIDTRGKNIIVSAGAGSGKTFVLKERVLKEVQNETSVENLVILTFTKNAAMEMKERIRKIIGEHPELAGEAEKVDSAYITTFDSYSSSLVKKYNYLLGMNKNFKIIDENIVKTEIRNIIDEIFDSYYENPTPLFNEFMDKNCYKNDTEIKKSILNIYGILTSFIGKDEYLDTYIDEHYKDEYLDKMLEEYNNVIFDKVSELIPLYEDLIEYTLNEKAIITNKDYMENIINATTIDELRDALSGSLARANKGYYEEGYKDIKDLISEREKVLKLLVKYPEKELKTQYLSTKNSLIIIIDILKKIDEKITLFKEEHNSYEFNDIAFKAIELVRDHEDVRNEIKNNIYEIMIDEYQDTNDIQDTFISYIANNNVYMVGDVKQSIYRFRNANPYLFKKNYDDYKDGVLGYRIDLTKNFRSRGEVIYNINDLFSIIMTDLIGGAKYKQEHQMGHGNLTYDENEMENYDYNMQVLKYDSENTNYKDEDIEAYIIANDIKKHMSNHEYAFGEKGLQPLSYSDFAILVDKSTNFDTLKKTLESFGIPAVIEKDVSIKEDDEILIIKNIINLLISIKKQDYGISFKHSFISIARSYICDMNDEDIFDIFVNKKDYKETDLYKKAFELSKIIDGLSNKEIITTIINEFDIINKLITVSDVNDRLMRLEYFINQATSLNDFGMDIYELNEFFDDILNNDEDIKARGKSVTSNAVTIMTIHGSKGLEYNFVYLPYLGSNFISNKDKPRYNLSKKYGFILPYYEEGIDNTFIYNLNTENEKLEILSEKIRLLYVAITRAKEQFIMINKVNPKITPENTFDEMTLRKCSSYADIINYLGNFFSKYTTSIDINTLGLDKKEDITTSNYKELIDESNTVITVNPINIDNILLESKHFSKEFNNILDKDTKYKMDLGTKLHYILEIYDFKNNNLNSLHISDKEKEIITNFLKHPEIKNIANGITYKEHQIKYNKDGNEYHGVIDLLVEYDDHFDIIDYKTSETDSPEYINQLNGYKDYILEKYNKPTNIYLYSLFKDELVKL